MPPPPYRNAQKSKPAPSHDPSELSISHLSPITKQSPTPGQSRSAGPGISQAASSADAPISANTFNIPPHHSVPSSPFPSEGEEGTAITKQKQRSRVRRASAATAMTWATQQALHSAASPVHGVAVAPAKQDAAQRSDPDRLLIPFPRLPMPHREAIPLH